MPKPHVTFLLFFALLLLVSGRYTQPCRAPLRETDTDRRVQCGACDGATCG